MGHFYTTVEAEGRDKKDAEYEAISRFISENGTRHSVREVLNPKFLGSFPPYGVVTKLRNGDTVHDFTVRNESAPKSQWVERWEFTLHTHA